MSALCVVLCFSNGCSFLTVSFLLYYVLFVFLMKANCNNFHYLAMKHSPTSKKSSVTQALTDADPNKKDSETVGGMFQ